MKNTHNASLLPLISAIILITLSLTLSFLYEIHKYPIWIKEGGVIESLSALGYFVAAFVMVSKGKLEYIIKYHYFIILTLFFGMRELDFHKKFTTMGIFKSKFYLSNSVPIAEKLIGLIVITILIYVIFKIIKNHKKDFIPELKKLSPVYIGIALIFISLVFAKAIDGLARKLRQIGVTITERSSTYFEVIEEVLEMGIPLLIIATLLSYFSQKHKHTSFRKQYD